MKLCKHDSLGLPPLRTSVELAEEFGITKRALEARLRLHDGPKPIRRHRGWDAGTRVYYNPTEVRAWWAAIHTEAA
jgi:hypothetical protein